MEAVIGDDRRRALLVPAQGKRIAKVVTFFLCDYRTGSLDDHDHEVERAWWSSLPEAAAVLSYEGEREMTVRALHLLTATG